MLKSKIFYNTSTNIEENKKANETTDKTTTKTATTTTTQTASNVPNIQESKESNVIAVNLMANAGYNPLAIIVVLTKQTGTYWDALLGKPANADVALLVYDYTGYAYPAKLKAGYACNEYKNFTAYANPIITARKSNNRQLKRSNKELTRFRKNSVKQISNFKTRGGLSGWDAAYGIIKGQ